MFLNRFSLTDTGKRGNVPNGGSYIKAISCRSQEYNERVEGRKLHELMMARILKYSEIKSLNAMH